MSGPMLSRVTTPLLLSFVCAVVSLVLFAKLADEMLEGETRHFDTAVRQFVHSRSSDGLTATMRFITFLGSPLWVSVVALSSCIALWVSGRRREAMFLAITLIGGSLVMWVLKVSFQRQRPPPFFDTRLPTSYSFPSGHALLSFCLYGAGASLFTPALKNRWIRIAIWTVASVLVAAIGVSRIYFGVHYPSDVVAGYLGGMVWLLGVGIAFPRWEISAYRR